MHDSCDFCVKDRFVRMKLLPQKLSSYVFERFLRIDTTGAVDPTVQWGVHYTPLPYEVIWRILGWLQLTPRDVFVDIGCGKGRVVCCACRFPVNRVVGVEVNPLLLEKAESNVRKMRRCRSRFEPLLMPAEQYHYDDATAIYLYNPFDKPIMEKVFGRIDASYRRKPRLLRVAYANCLHEEFLQRTGWLKKREEWPASQFPGFGCPISLWSSDGSF